jgi:predicted P-loop ATPase
MNANEKSEAITQTSRNEILEQYIKDKFKPRYNIIKKRVEITKNDGKTYKSIEDRELKIFFREMKKKGFKTSLSEIAIILDSDLSSDYHPFDAYYSRLKLWDGQTDHIQNFLNLVKVKNDEYLYQFFKKWIVAVVANTLDENITNEQMFIFYGGQGIGKTTFMKKLVPNALIEYSHTGNLNLENKDSAIKMSQTMLCNLDELSSITPKNIELFKQTLSLTKFQERRPYAIYSDEMTKYASFCGSTNNKDFLYDKTGNRRFLCFEIESLDLNALYKFNIDDVYAQALHLYMDGFQYWFDHEENKLIEQNNVPFLHRNAEEEAILDVFKITDDSQIKMTATGIREYLVELGAISRNVDAQKIGRALTKLGFQSSKSNGRMLYNVALVNDVKISEPVKLSVLEKRPTLPALPSVITKLDHNANTKKLDL